MKVWMTNKEINKIKSYLKPNHIMLEWGCGGSTLEFSKLVKMYYSIEHEPAWFRQIRNKIRLKKLSNISLSLVKPNCTSYVVGRMRKEDFEDYVEYIHKLDVDRFDVVLIDGRARPHCAVECLKYIDKDSIVFIHDYYKRPAYHWIEKYYDVIDSVKDGKTLVVLKKK